MVYTKTADLKILHYKNTNKTFLSIALMKVPQGNVNYFSQQ